MEWSNIKPFALTLLVVVVALVAYSAITKTVEVDAAGKEVAGGKVYKTKLKLFSKKAA